MSEVKEHITCAEAIFCPSWGEYKVAENNVVISARLWNVNICKVRNITITNPDECCLLRSIQERKAVYRLPL